jgi:hypothetical protein
MPSQAMKSAPRGNVPAAPAFAHSLESRAFDVLEAVESLLNRIAEARSLAAVAAAKARRA